MEEMNYRLSEGKETSKWINIISVGIVNYSTKDSLHYKWKIQQHARKIKYLCLYDDGLINWTLYIFRINNY